MAEYINSDSYQIGDTVSINSKNGRSIGKIEEIQLTEGTFTYTEFQAPGESQISRQPHHGKWELIKSDIVKKEDLRSVMQKVFVYKLKDYIKLSRDERTSKQNFVVRQFYEEERKILRPEALERECFDHIILNPDDELIQCHCGKFYRVSCITEENSICDSCGIDILSDNVLGSDLEKRRKDPVFLDSMVPLKKLNNGFDFSSAGNILAEQNHLLSSVNVIPPPREPVNHSKRVNLNKISSNEKVKKINQLKKRVTDRANALLDKFKQSMQLSRQIPEQERIRQKIRENFFFAVIYGFEELKQKYEEEPEYFEIYDKEKLNKMISMDNKSEIDFVKNITLAIEANLYHKFNRNVGKASEYTSRSRFIVLNLKHEKNIDLRLKILLEEITPSRLAEMNEDEQAPKSVHNERQQRQLEFFNAKEITEDMKIIAKSRKGDFDVTDMSSRNFQFSPPTALDINNGDSVENRTRVKNESLLEVENMEERVGKDIHEDSRAIDKDIEDTMQGLTYDKFKTKCLDRYEKYLPKEVAQELQSELV